MEPKLYKTIRLTILSEIIPNGVVMESEGTVLVGKDMRNDVDCITFEFRGKKQVTKVEIGLGEFSKIIGDLKL